MNRQCIIIVLAFFHEQRISSSSSAASTHEPLKPDDKKLCHQILYDFLHGKTSNPVDAGQRHSTQAY